MGKSGWCPLRVLPSLMAWNSYWNVSSVSHRNPICLFQLPSAGPGTEPGTQWGPITLVHSMSEWIALLLNMQTFHTRSHFFPYSERRLGSETTLGLYGLLNSPWKAREVANRPSLNVYHPHCGNLSGLRESWQPDSYNPAHSPSGGAYHPRKKIRTSHGQESHPPSRITLYFAPFSMVFFQNYPLLPQDLWQLPLWQSLSPKVFSHNLLLVNACFCFIFQIRCHIPRQALPDPESWLCHPAKYSQKHYSPFLQNTF